METTAAIIGGGIAGLAAAAWLEHDHGIEAVVLEASQRAGGKVHTEHADGHTLEWGPQGFLDNAPDTLDLATLLGLGDDLVGADESSAARFIARDGMLRRVPLAPPAFLTSDVLPLGPRLRVLFEVFGRRRPVGDESVFEFARRRIGRGAADVLVDAMVTGVFAGDPRELSLAATFPRMAEMESRHGSLTRAMLAKRREAKRAGVTGGGGPTGPGGTLTTLRQGMGQLSRSLGEALGTRLLLDTPVRALERSGDGFMIRAEGRNITARRVLLALPAAQAANLVGGLAPEAVAPMSAIPTAPIAVVMSAYANPDTFGQPLDGFGFLVPGGEHAGILGCLYCHSIFPDQAPPGHLLLRTMLGGARDPDVLELDDDGLLARVDGALRRYLGRAPSADRTWIVRHPAGITQYNLGHLARVEAIESATRAADLEVTGSSYRGVSVNDCIRQARAAAGRLAERLG